MFKRLPNLSVIEMVVLKVSNRKMAVRSKGQNVIVTKVTTAKRMAKTMSTQLILEPTETPLIAEKESSVDFGRAGKAPKMKFCDRMVSLSSESVILLVFFK